MSIVSFGELLIDFVSMESGVTVGEASGFYKTPGGAPANVAVAAARLGIPAAFLGMVGDDPFGHFLEGVLRTDNVDTRGLRFHADARTALAFVSLTSDGDRSFSFYRNPSADMLMRPEDVALDVIDNYRVFHYGSITLINEPSRSATLAAVEYARSRGKLLSYDPNLRMALWPNADAARAGMLAGLEFAHVVKVTDEELEFMTGGRNVSELWRPGMRVIAITHGAGGATLYHRYGENVAQISAPGFVVSVVDTTGAGDGFIAGLITKLLEHGGDALLEADYSAHLPEIARFANAVGALATTERGGIPGLPKRAAVDAFLAGS
jgi:fructokinase